MTSMDYLYQRRGFLNYLLLPLGLLYSSFVFLRWRFARPKKLPCQVICVGGAILGGAGKTPIVRALSHYFKKHGRVPHIISRGYGRKLSGNFRVESHHSAYDVGDEALMLAKDFPVWVADNRFIAGEMAIEAGCDLIILDDGYQNPQLHKDVHILVSDGGYGLGNRFVFPSGCLREPLFMSLGRADLHIILSSDGEEAHYRQELKRLMRPSFHASLSPVVKDIESLPRGNWIVFAGLARPYKFFATAYKIMQDMLGTPEGEVHIISYRPYDDHHFYSDSDKRELWRLAKDYDATLVTSEKDSLRFSSDERSDLCVIYAEAILDESILDKFFNY